jgi:hypothetical protein
VSKVIASIRKIREKRPPDLEGLEAHLGSLTGRKASDQAVDSLAANLLTAGTLRDSG